MKPTKKKHGFIKGASQNPSSQQQPAPEMAWRSRSIITGVNMMAGLVSIPVIGVGVSLMNKQVESCFKFLQWPIIILGILILLTGFAGALAGFFRSTPLLILYLLSMFALIFLLSSLILFVFTVTGPSSGHSLPNRGYLEYNTDDFSPWLRRRVKGPLKWERIKYCISSTTSICSDLNQTFSSAADFFMTRLSPFQSGCCKPPTLCGYQYMGATNWIDPINMIADEDCVRWDNDPGKLCYSCDACGGGVLEVLRGEWRRANLVFIVSLVLLVVFYLMGCGAFRQAKTDDLFGKYRRGDNT